MHINMHTNLHDCVKIIVSYGASLELLIVRFRVRVNLWIWVLGNMNIHKNVGMKICMKMYEHTYNLKKGKGIMYYKHTFFNLGCMDIAYQWICPNIYANTPLTIQYINQNTDQYIYHYICLYVKLGLGIRLSLGLVLCTGLF